MPEQQPEAQRPLARARGPPLQRPKCLGLQTYVQFCNHIFKLLGLRHGADGVDEGQEGVAVIRQVQVQHGEPRGALQGVEQEQRPPGLHRLQGKGPLWRKGFGLPPAGLSRARCCLLGPGVRCEERPPSEEGEEAGAAGLWSWSSGSAAERKDQQLPWPLQRTLTLYSQRFWGGFTPSIFTRSSSIAMAFLWLLFSTW